MKIDPSETLILVRLSAELSTKARGTRRRFMRRLVENVREAMSAHGTGFHVESQWTRIFIRTRGGAEAAEVLKRVPGISSFSVVIATCRADLDEIVRTGADAFGERVAGKTFAVRARRTGTHPFNSNDVAWKLGAALNPGARVDLDRPEVEVEVEVRDKVAIFFSGREEGFGGLPMAVEGRAVCLISGGFDSAVAAWLMLKRGVHIDYVFCNLAGDAYERSVARVAKILADDWSYGSRPSLHVVDFSEVLDDLRASADPRYWQIVLKRLMYSAATQVASEIRAQVIITGEAIGQVSSQTLSNLVAIDGASPIPVFRPLLGFDKMEIVALARRIGTFEVSSKVKEYCAISSVNPVTNATARQTEMEEAKLDREILDRAHAGRRVLDLKGLQSSDLILNYIFTDEVPENAVILDLRGDREWEEWHYPGSERRDSWEITANPSGLDRNRTYVVHCDQGAQAVQVAEVLQREGIEAYAYRGGTGAIRRHLRKRPGPSPP